MINYYDTYNMIMGFISIANVGDGVITVESIHYDSCLFYGIT